MDWRQSRFTRHHNLLTGAAPITGPIVDNGRTAGKKVGRKVAGGASPYVGGASAVGDTVSLTSLSGGSGASPIEGDVIVVFRGIGSTTDFDVQLSTAGFTEVADLFGPDTSDANLGVFYKVAGPTPDTAVSAVTTSGTRTIAVMVFRGINTTTPLDVTPTTLIGSNSATINPPGITTATDNAIIVAGGSAAGTDTYPGTLPAGYSAFQWAQQGGAVWSLTAMGYFVAGVAGVQSPATLGGSGNAALSGHAQVTIALRPA